MSRVVTGWGVAATVTAAGVRSSKGTCDCGARARGSGGWEASGGRRTVVGSGGGSAGQRRHSRERGVLEEARLRSTRGSGNRGSSISATAARRGYGNQRLRLRPKGWGVARWRPRAALPMV
ncbi:hypothetical protein C4D60_Mb05t17400 [Musa balbisiana]|uniref:Uncharacterized protein n=1 Tax=Musa balbisiana TaxID=52838 RepID=A0A4S8JWT9_MUSBA|nr:hypothetical protein C4D60_Mb05t17400 [Musa balbisiana]